MIVRRAIPVLLAAVVVCGAEPDGIEFSKSELRRILGHSPLAEPPAGTNAVAEDPRAARLGQFLFFDTGLSANGEVACSTCHDPVQSFTDGKPVFEGIGKGTRHTPALWNVAHNRWYFLDGRADSLWAQALQPIEIPIEMGSTRLRLAHQVYDDPALRHAYEVIFGDMPDLDDLRRFPAEGRPVPDDRGHPHHIAWTSMSETDRDAVNRVFVNVGKAMEAYERKLVSRRSPFDEFVEGLRENDPARQAALSPSAKRGLKLFIGPGQCRLCHVGPNFTDGEFHNIRVPPRGGGLPRDAGRFDGLRKLQSSPFNAAGVYSDDREGRAARRLEFVADTSQNWGAFKTPSLRNVALTPPYMHQGQFERLDDVLEYYSTLEGAITLDHHDETILVPRNFTPQDKEDLIAFLEALTDTDIDPALLEPVASPSP